MLLFTDRSFQRTCRILQARHVPTFGNREFILQFANGIVVSSDLVSEDFQVDLDIVVGFGGASMFCRDFDGEAINCCRENWGLFGQTTPQCFGIVNARELFVLVLITGRW